jgi:hypothetical protein
MNAYDLFVLAIAGANGGLAYWFIRNRQRVPARVKARRTRR